MQYTYRTWNEEDYYDFRVEFNRIESYNEYCKDWLRYYNIPMNFVSKTDWTMKDIPDIKDYNRIKNNINLILETIDSINNKLSISTQYNQVWNVEKANEIEVRLKEYLKYIGEFQFANNITGLATTGNSLKLGGV